MPNRVWRTVRFVFFLANHSIPSFYSSMFTVFSVIVFSLCGVHIDVDPDTGITVTYGPSQIRGRWMRHCCFMVSSISNEEQCSCFTWARACPQQASGKLLHAVKCRASTETTGLLFLNELPPVCIVSSLSCLWTTGAVHSDTSRSVQRMWQFIKKRTLNPPSPRNWASQ